MYNHLLSKVFRITIPIRCLTLFLQGVFFGSGTNLRGTFFGVGGVLSMIPNLTKVLKLMPRFVENMLFNATNSPSLLASGEMCRLCLAASSC